MKTAIVILAWNNKNFLHEFLPGVKDTAGRCSKTDVDVIVVDNNSTDGTVEWLRAEHSGSVSLIEYDENLGYAGGYDRALKQLSEYELFICLNSDVCVAGDWLNHLITMMIENPDIGACQPKIVSYEDPRVFEYAGAAGGLMTKLGYPFCLGRTFFHIERDYGQYQKPEDLFWASGACLVVRRDAYIQAGGFDGRFFAHFEEVDLCWRMQCMGWKIKSCPQAKVLHVGGGSLSNGNPRKIFLNFRNGLYMLRKNLTPGQHRIIIPLRFVMDTLIAIVFLLKGELGWFRAVVQAHREYLRTRKDFQPISNPKPLSALKGVKGWFPRLF